MIHIVSVLLYRDMYRIVIKIKVYSPILNVLIFSQRTQVNDICMFTFNLTGLVPAKRQLKQNAVPTVFAWSKNDSLELSRRNLRALKRQVAADEKEAESRLAVESISHEEFK